MCEFLLFGEFGFFVNRLKNGYNSKNGNNSKYNKHRNR